MASRHTRTPSTASHHMRTSSTSSEILINETVSSLQRCVFGNIFRSQRQFTRFAIFFVIFLLGLYMLGPFGLSRKRHENHDDKPKADAALRSLEETKTVSEYRATYFEEMGKKLANKEWAVKVESLHHDKILTAEVKEGQGSEVASELKVVAEKVTKVAQIVSRCKEVPGVSMVLVKGDNSVHIPVGLADVEKNRHVTMDTRFLLNSISKTFLGQLLAVLISESSHKLSWDSRVADILGPEFRLATEELTREVTLRDLLSHSTGLSSGNLAVRATYPQGWTRSKLVKNLKYLPPSAPFRKTFLYSNMASVLTVHVAEVIGGVPWEQLMVDKLLKPLGMLDSRPITSQSELEREDVSRLYVPVEGRLQPVDLRIFNQGPLAPLALLTTTATDVTKWLQFNLRQGKLAEGKSLIPRNLWLPMWTRQIELSPMFLAGVQKSGAEWPVKDLSDGYGLVWFINSYRGLQNFWHGGGLYSHYTLAWHFPEKNIALYAVINGYSGDSRPFSIVESLAYYAADLLLGYQPWLNGNNICNYPKLFPSNETSASEMQENLKEMNQNLKNVRDFRRKGISDDKNEAFKRKDTDNDFERNFNQFDLKRNQESEKGDGFERNFNQFDLKRNQESDKGEEFERSFNQFDLKPKEAQKGEYFKRDFNQFDLKQNQGMEKGESSHQDIDSNVKSPGLLDVLKLTPEKQSSNKKSERQSLPLDSYLGSYFSPLFGNYSVFQDQTSGQLHCQMNILTCDLHHTQGHNFSVELTKSLRFLSKPSKTSPAKMAFVVSFVEGSSGEISAVDIFSSWAMELAPLRFEKLR